MARIGAHYDEFTAPSERLWRGLARLRSRDVFYAPLDGSRIDYHPCGRPGEHPRYIDPQMAGYSWPGDALDSPMEYPFHPPHQCGRCGRMFDGEEARGQYILHPCIDAQWQMTVSELRELALRIDVEATLAEIGRSILEDLRLD